MMQALRERRSSTGWALVVEDEPDICSILIEGLALNGFRVVHAKTAPEAVAKLGRQAFDCVLMDLRLPHGSGEKVISFMRSDIKGPNYRTPILVVSGYLDAELVKKIRGQVNDILVKPFRIETLVSRVKGLLEKPGAVEAPHEGR